MRAVLAALLLAPALAFADAPAVSSAADSAATSPLALDAVRLFNSTEAYHLEPGDVRVELRYTSGEPDTQPTMEVRAEVGLSQHFQLNLAEDLSTAEQSVPTTATPISLRYSLGSNEGDVPGDPAIEVQVTPRPNAPLQASLRLLLAEELMPRLVVAANGYVQQNIDRSSPAGVDGSFGVTAGASYAIVPGHVRVGAEGQLGGAQYGEPGYALVLAGGPNAVLSFGPVAATLSTLFDLTQRRVGVEPMATVGWTF